MEYKWISFIALAFVVGLFVGHLFTHGCGSSKDGHWKYGDGMKKHHYMKQGRMHREHSRSEKGYQHKREDLYRTQYNDGMGYRQEFKIYRQ